MVISRAHLTLWLGGPGSTQLVLDSSGHMATQMPWLDSCFLPESGACQELQKWWVRRVCPANLPTGADQMFTVSFCSSYLSGAMGSNELHDPLGKPGHTTAGTWHESISCLGFMWRRTPSAEHAAPNNQRDTVLPPWWRRCDVQCVVLHFGRETPVSPSGALYPSPMGKVSESL